ncbi:MAG: hypothetical protein LC659_13320 [Myxococcales bacterium]|nr:hypothetical protein [Myxococcales bacterium]
MRNALVTLLSLHAALAGAQSDRTGTRAQPELPPAVTPDLDGAALAGDGVAQRVQLTTEARAGIATFVGTRYALVGHEGRPELSVTAAVEKHVGATLLRADAAFAREIDEDQRDAVLALSALRAVVDGLAVGVAGRAIIDLDDGRDDGGEVRWEGRGGAAANVRLGRRASLTLTGGAAAIATRVDVRTGPFALAAVGGWF